MERQEMKKRNKNRISLVSSPLRRWMTRDGYTCKRMRKKKYSVICLYVNLYSCVSIYEFLDAFLWLGTWHTCTLDYVYLTRTAGRKIYRHLSQRRFKNLFVSPHPPVPFPSPPQNTLSLDVKRKEKKKKGVVKYTDSNNWWAERAKKNLFSRGS